MYAEIYEDSEMDFDNVTIACRIDGCDTLVVALHLRAQYGSINLIDNPDSTLVAYTSPNASSLPSGTAISCASTIALDALYSRQ